MDIIIDKTLNFVFCEPIHEGLWDRVLSETIDPEIDIVWESFQDISSENLRTLVKDLYTQFEDIFEEGIRLGYQRAYEGE